MSSDLILKEFNTHFTDLTNDEIEALLLISKIGSFENKQTIIKEQQRILNIYWIAKGMIRGYFLSESGIERTIILRPTKSFFAAPGILQNKSKSSYTFEAVGDTQLIQINYASFIRLTQTYAIISQIFISALQENLLTLLSRVEVLTSTTAKERFERLFAERPDFFQKVPLKYIANYLGITPNSLSRIINARKT